MAKNPQKKRVTHIYNMSDNQYNKGEMQSKAFDYVKTIMEDMTTTKTVDYNPYDDPLKMELLNLTKDEHLQVQNPPASSSNDYSQAVKSAVKKFRKFSNTRKFPLMEKSQKILQQLKHNRSIPKPRAHLASIDDWSCASKSMINTKKVLEQKKVVSKQKRSVKSNDLTQAKTDTLSNIPQMGTTDICHKNKESYIVKNKTMDLKQVNRNAKMNISTKISKSVLAATDSSHKSKESCIVKSKTKVFAQVNVKPTTKDLTEVSKPVLVATDAICKKNELCIVKNIDNVKNLKKIPKRCEPPDKHTNAKERVLKKCNVNNVFSSKTTQSGENSDCNTTDSEYERFIQNNKVEFEEEIPKNRKKKYPKKKKANKKKKSLSNKKLQKSFPLESTDQIDSSNLDELTETDQEKELTRSFSRESSVEHYDSNCYSDSSDGEDVEKGTAKKLNKKLPITEKVVHTRKSNRINKVQKRYSSISSANTNDSNHFDNSSDGSMKIPNKSERSISMECLVEHLDLNCYNNASSDKGGEMNKTIESTMIKPSISINDKCENILRNPKILENTSNNLQCGFNEDENKSGYRPFKEFSSEDSPNLSVLSNLNSKLDSSVDFENINCKVSLRPSAAINETSTNCTQNNSQELQNINSNLRKSSADKCASISSNFDKCNKLPTENLVIDLSDCASESKDAEPPQHISQKENFENLKRVQNIESANADSEESDIEIIEIVPAPNTSKLATCGVSAACPDNLNRMMDVDYSTNKTLENEIKYSQSPAFENIVQKVNEPMVLDCSVSKNMNSSIEECFSEKLVKKEPKIVESNNPVYMTGMCQEYENENISKIDSDLLGSSVFNECKREKCKTTLCEMDAFDEDDDIMIIEPPVSHVKQEVIDDDIIIDYVTVKKEHNPKSTVTPLVSSKRKNEMCIAQLESDLKHECPTSCKVPKISNIVDDASVRKELPLVDCSFTESLLNRKIFNDPLTSSKVLPLLELYKKELVMYQEIIRTEENVEAGLKMVEAHQAEKLMCIRGLIQNLVKDHPCYNKIYSDTVETKKHDSLQSSMELNYFQKSSTAKLQSSSSKFSCETPCRSSQDSSEGSSSKLTASLPSVHIKTEKELSISSVDPVSVDVCCSAKLQSSSSKFSCETPHKNSQDSSEGSSSKLNASLPSVHIKTEKELSIPSVDPVSVDVCHSVARIKTEPGTSKITESSLSSDVPENKQALKLLGKKCDVCGKDAIAACQRCAKAFFCSNKCGEQFWNDGHERVCDKYV